MLGFGFQAWLLGLKPMGFGFRPPPVKPLQGANWFPTFGLCLFVTLFRFGVLSVHGDLYRHSFASLDRYRIGPFASFSFFEN